MTVRNYALYQGFKGAKGKGVDNKMDNRVDNRVDNSMDNRVDNKVPQTKNDNNDLNNDKECKRKESPSRKPEPPAGGGEWE